MSRNINLVHLLTTGYQRVPDYVLFKLLFTNGEDLWVWFLHVGVARLDSDIHFNL